MSGTCPNRNCTSYRHGFCTKKGYGLWVFCALAPHIMLVTEKNVWGLRPFEHQECTCDTQQNAYSHRDTSVRRISGTVAQTKRASNGLLVCFACPEDPWTRSTTAASVILSQFVLLCPCQSSSSCFERSPREGQIP